MRYMIKAITNFLYPVVKFSYRQKHLHAIRVGFVNILPAGFNRGDSYLGEQFAASFLPRIYEFYFYTRVENFWR